ncbi:hypothetical protein OG943_16575 [Amycolatopsis sp. NBC_00345]|uniref:hypothetical protein n=1 Tax=Amycolatopsis sp. NBC_00345 TaxID=2975955 RepID=UPI002E26B60F
MLTREAVDDVLDWARAEDLPTPALLMTPGVLADAVARIREQLGGRISFALKANAHPAMVRVMAGAVDEFNVTNLDHLRLLLDQGVSPSRIAFAHPVTTAETVQAAVACGVSRFVLDDPRGLEVLKSAGVPLKVTLRLLPPDIGQSPRSLIRFGGTHEVLRELAGKAVVSGMEIEALSFFVGTAGEGMAEAVPFRRAIEHLARLSEQLGRDGISVPTMNIGGGFPGAQRRFFQQNPEYFRRIGDAARQHFGPDQAVLCEPGRYLSESTMAVLTRVVADRRVAGRRLVYVDASAYAGLFESCFIDDSDAGPVVQAGRSSAVATPAALVGPVMDSFDVVTRSTSLAPLTTGQLLLLPNVGAYAWNYFVGCEGLRAPVAVEVPEQLAASFAHAWFD